MLVREREVRRVAELHEPRGAGLVAHVDAGAVHGEVGEEQDVAGLGLHRHELLDGEAREVEAALRVVLARSREVAARRDAHAALGVGGVVEVEDRGGHPVMGVREERVVLMGRERGAVLRRLDEHLRLVQLHVRGAQDGRGDVREARVDEQPGEGGVVELGVVQVLEAGRPAHGDLGGGVPGGSSPRSRAAISSWLRSTLRSRRRPPPCAGRTRRFAGRTPRALALSAPARTPSATPRSRRSGCARARRARARSPPGRTAGRRRRTAAAGA